MTSYYLPGRPTKAEPAAEPSDLDNKLICSPTPRDTTTLNVWRQFDRNEAGMDFFHEKGEEKHQPARKTTQTIPNKSTPKMDLFLHDIFCNQKVSVGDAQRYSRYFVTETRGPFKFTVVPTKKVEPRVEVTPTGLPDVEIDLEAEMDVCTLTEEPDEFDDISKLAEEMSEDLEEPKEDKRVCRRFLNWLNELLADLNRRKIGKTHRRELEEGDEIYRTSYMTRPMTRAEREQRKRQKLIRRDEQRQRVKKYLDDHWEIQRHKKEALKLKEEQRYEKWAAEHGLTVPESSPAESKKRMSKWEKRFLRLENVFTR